eukprot:GHVU01124833.1.p1 GENE.GHVU01124833.1~~GHVU01124833.1.p1  ORF type:complete len:121 (+),score=5.66 GHVU01124833.1:137-499(+)
MAGHFRSSVWDPSLILAQMLTMQCYFYVSLGFWVFAADFIAGTYRSLDHLLEFQLLQLKDVYGRLLLGAPQNEGLLLRVYGYLHINLIQMCLVSVESRFCCLSEYMCFGVLHYENKQTMH